MGFGVILKPRGIFRILQIVLAIGAFITTARFSMSISLKVGSKLVELKGCDLSYPSFTMSCATLKKDFGGGSSAMGFVATGSLSFIYAFLIIPLYLFAEELYLKKKLLHFGDIIFTLLFTIGWLVASIEWAKGLAEIKHNSEKYLDLDAIEISGYGMLYASLAMGFANFLLWGASFVFIGREIFLHHRKQKQEAMTEFGIPQPYRKS